MEKGKAKLVGSPADKRYEVCVGPMQEDEKQYLLQTGLLFEDSSGELFEKSTSFDETMDSEADGDLENSRKADNGNCIGDICEGPLMASVGARLMEGVNDLFTDLEDDNECFGKGNVSRVKDSDDSLSQMEKLPALADPVDLEEQNAQDSAISGS